MAHKIAKKVRKAMKRNWSEFYKDIFTLSFRDRWRLGWALVTYRKPKDQKEKDKIWNERKPVK